MRSRANQGTRMESSRSSRRHPRSLITPLRIFLLGLQLCEESGEFNSHVQMKGVEDRRRRSCPLDPAQAPGLLLDCGRISQHERKNFSVGMPDRPTYQSIQRYEICFATYIIWPNQSDLCVPCGSCLRFVDATQDYRHTRSLRTDRLDAFSPQGRT